MVVRINGVYTKWCYRDVIEVVENAAQFLDCIMVPKVEHASDVSFVAELLHFVAGQEALVFGTHGGDVDFHDDPILFGLRIGDFDQGGCFMN